MFRHLKTKLTFAYGGLLGLILLAVAGLVLASVARSAEANVRAELQATASVYERLWQINESQLADNAEIMARDFGFREAVATEDADTIASALENLRNRLGLARAFLVFEDGRALEAGSSRILDTSPAVMSAVLADDHASGLIAIGDVQFQAVSSPVMAPARVGWVIFASRLDAAELGELESLSPIALSASIIAADADGITELPAPTKSMIQASAPLDGFGELPAGHLLLNFPVAAAMAPFRPMLVAIAFLAAGGLCALVLCSWFISRTLTQPITRLDEATRQLASGVPVDLSINSPDEIGRLAQSFSVMAREIELREQSMVKMSLTDTETLLPNRRALQNAIAEATTGQDAIYTVAIGIDRFPQIMTAIGQSATNELMAKLGARLDQHTDVRMTAMATTDVIGILVSANNGLDGVDKILSYVSHPIAVSGEMIDIELSAGCCIIGLHSALSPVDEAMVALQQGRALRQRVHLFDEQAYGDPSSTLSLMSDMVSGLSDGSVYLAYQPKFDLRRGAVHSVEALLRWDHPTRGKVSPDTFVGFAEETGHIRPLSQWVMSQAKADREIMAAAGFDLKMSVNISGRLLTDSAFLDWAIAELGDACERFCFEVTETAVIDDPKAALANIERVRSAGIEISIDDYGSGLSSLSYLKQIPAQELKIDKSFVLSLQSNSSDALLIKSTIDLAHSLGMSVTVEGVETADALQLLQGMGADVAQGYYIARPLPLADVLAFFQAGVPSIRQSAVQDRPSLANRKLAR
ncbi:MAG: EAL domain-containing protein [Hyphomonas sp.]|uniref:putative bifunctional diguanylate cyclase/phosphodiesterase n=1 Tax=Hyphomonas sp. TaxID=87 RepID=UPI0030031850